MRLHTSLYSPRLTRSMQQPSLVTKICSALCADLREPGSPPSVACFSYFHRGGRQRGTASDQEKGAVRRLNSDMSIVGIPWTVLSYRFR